MTTKTISLSGYSKTLAINQLSKSLNKGDYDSSCYWSVEMHISGWIGDWWLAILNYSALNIHTKNPKIGKFLYKISNDYPGIRGINSTNNSSEIRQTIALIVGVCNFSPKDIGLVFPKPITIPVRDEVKVLNKIETTPLHRCVLDASLRGDPQIMLKLLSQLAHSIDRFDYHAALRVINVGTFFSKHSFYKRKIVCAHRTWNGLDKKHWNSWLLFLWDVLMELGKKRNIGDIVGSWRAMFIINCEYTKIRVLQSYILSCISLLSHKININNQCIFNEKTNHKGCTSIDLMYSDIIKQLNSR